MLKNFNAYQKSVVLYRICEGMKARAYIKDQLLRASLSVVLNLVEGSAKTSEKDRKRFYGIGFASLRETQALLEILGQIKAQDIADQLAAMLYRLSR